ncbi:hypothetical protein ACS34_004964 [Salmonella enterica subsp. enterica serovar Poona]|nr:hypothetical protein [Salmonella enterica subsp. enterica serovar Poona]
MSARHTQGRPRRFCPPRSQPTAFTLSHINAAYTWLCKSRRRFPANADLWHLRFHWNTERARILRSLHAGTYRFQPLSLVSRADGSQVAVWSSADALVIKCLTLYLENVLPVSRWCEHLRGHGGGRASVRQTHARLLSGRYPFVFRTDIRGYYARISKSLLYEQLCRYVSSPVLRDLLCQFLHYSVEDGGEFHTPLRGIPRGSALSPLLAAFHLTETDNVFSRNRHVTYARYMDDFLILSPTRWHLRRAVRMLNRHFAQAGFEQHPDKTFIGRVEKGFDWMGFWFTEKGCDGVAPRALQNFKDRLRRLYERVRQWPEDLRLCRMVGYVRNWLRWSYPQTTARKLSPPRAPWLGYCMVYPNMYPATESSCVMYGYLVSPLQGCASYGVPCQLLQRNRLSAGIFALWNAYPSGTGRACRWADASVPMPTRS